jgi:ubiquinone/menaquinone biosynthesis C-methylase UbiE
MDHFKNLYTNHAEAYHQLISAEDIDSNLLPAMESIMPFSDRIVLDIGSGTGRIPLLLQKRARKIISMDLHRAMLLEQDIQKEQVSGDWGLVQGDMRILPFPDSVFDIVTAGWALGHFVDWFGDDWQIESRSVLQEMARVVRTGGVLIIIETLTTGALVPAPPTTGLGEYYSWLENKWGFKRQQIRTDYKFPNLEEAVGLVGFFFGEELAKRVRHNHWVRLPEWTGVWEKVNASD